MPNIMQTQSVGISSLSAIITKIAIELVITVFANNCIRHIRLFSFRLKLPLTDLRINPLGCLYISIYVKQFNT
jgi:hypothetical protein